MLVRYCSQAQKKRTTDGRTGYINFLDAFNPNGSLFAIEGITSPDGRVLGKMGHSERWQKGIYRNVPGEYDMKLFESAVKYFQ